MEISKVQGNYFFNYKNNNNNIDFVEHVVISPFFLNLSAVFLLVKLIIK